MIFRILSIMHLSMLSPRVGGGQADPGDFDIFIEARVKFPTPGHLVNVKFPHPSGKFFCKRHVLEQIPDPGAVLKCQNPVPGESCLSQNPVGSPPPYPGA